MKTVALAIRCFHCHISSVLLAILWWFPLVCSGQKVKDVPQAFEALNSEPEIFFFANNIDVPTDGGHLQGVQVVQQNGTEKLFISGSSHTQAYILQLDLAAAKADRLIPLMNEPFRHAGGFQVSGDYLVTGIEDNYTRTSSRVCLYSSNSADFYEGRPRVIIEREGEAERKTAGATGLLAMPNDYLAVVANWNSREWDFYLIDPEKHQHEMIETFRAPDDWAAYQSINLISDDEAIYAIGFYQKEEVGYADLILVSKTGTVELIMKKVITKGFNGANEVDFSAAAGLQVDREGKLHIWGTQRDGLERIAVNRFSPQ